MPVQAVVCDEVVCHSHPVGFHWVAIPVRIVAHIRVVEVCHRTPRAQRGPGNIHGHLSVTQGRAAWMGGEKEGAERGEAGTCLGFIHVSNGPPLVLIFSLLPLCAAP